MSQSNSSKYNIIITKQIVVVICIYFAVAVKAGGMRVARTHRNSGSEKPPVENKPEEEEEVEEGTV